MFHWVVRPAVALCTSVLLLAGCGGAESEPSLAKAAARTEATGSSRIAIYGTGGARGEGARFDCEGEADYTDKRIRIRCDYPSGDLEAMVVGDFTYVRGAAFLGGDARKWVKEPTYTGENALQEFTPEKLLSLLRAASRETERVGEEAVRGVETVRYRLTVDCDKADLECAATTEVEVWIDDDGVVRRIELHDDRSEGTVEFYDFGVDVNIVPPPAGEIQAVDDPSPAAKPVELPPCGGVEARPIGIEQATSALRRHGFSVKRACGQDRVAAILSNHASDDPAQTLEREGLVSCFLFVKPQGSNVIVVRGADGADAELELANLTCTILADSPRAEEKIRPLKQAFAELKLVIRP